jgi:hypothetical protein
MILDGLIANGGSNIQTTSLPSAGTQGAIHDVYTSHTIHLLIVLTQLYRPASFRPLYQGSSLCDEWLRHHFSILRYFSLATRLERSTRGAVAEYDIAVFGNSGPGHSSLWLSRMVLANPGMLASVKLSYHRAWGG